MGEEKTRTCLHHSGFSGGFLRSWLLSCLSQSVDGPSILQMAVGPLWTKRSCVTCCCSRRPMAQQTKADIVWWPLPQWERSGVCIWHSGFWGRLFEGLVSVSLISEKRQELAYSRCLGATKNEELGNMLLLQRTYSIADTHQREQEITNSWK